MKIRNKSVLFVLVILAIGLIGTGLSTLYTQKVDTGVHGLLGDVSKVSCGFPLGWYGYSLISGDVLSTHPPSPSFYWFSLESFLLDAALWFAVSFFVTFATIKSVNMLHKTRRGDGKRKVMG